MTGESGWCQCSLLKQGRKGSRLQGGLLICNVCDLPILEGAAARSAFSGDEAAELVPTSGAATMEVVGTPELGPNGEGSSSGAAGPVNYHDRELKAASNVAFGGCVTVMIVLMVLLLGFCAVIVLLLAVGRTGL